MEQTIAYIKRAHKGDKQARDTLVLGNQGLVWSVVQRFLGRGHDKEELFQIGCIGLMKAVDKFDVSYEVCFSTYAVPVIMGEIRRFLRDDGMVKVSRSMKEKGYLISNARKELTDMQISPVYTGAPTDAREDVERRVYDLLAELNIPFTRVDHEEAHDMDACVEISRVLGVDICKNLLLTPRNRSTFYLLCLPGDKPFLTKDFSKQIGSSRLSFATAEDLQALLGVQPGSASVLGLMNDPEHRVQLCFDRPVIESEWFGCHPCRNTSSLRLKTRDVLDVFLKHTGHTATVVDL